MLMGVRIVALLAQSISAGLFDPLQAPSALSRSPESVSTISGYEHPPQAARRVLQRRDLILNEGDQDTGRTLEGPLQHHPATLLARLSTPSTRVVADSN